SEIYDVTGPVGLRPSTESRDRNPERQAGVAREPETVAGKRGIAQQPEEVVKTIKRSSEYPPGEDLRFGLVRLRPAVHEGAVALGEHDGIQHHRGESDQ